VKAKRCYRSLSPSEAKPCYGATGYTGKLAARTAKEKGLEPILAGRNEAKLKALAEPLGFQYRTFDLSDKAKLDKALGEADAVLHIAGPFSATSEPMADASLRARTHYLDITGEIDVFEALAARNAEATISASRIGDSASVQAVTPRLYAKRTFDKAVKRLWANRHLDLTLIQTLPTLKASHALSGSKTPIGLAANSREEGCFPP